MCVTCRDAIIIDVESSARETTHSALATSLKGGGGRINKKKYIRQEESINRSIDESISLDKRG